MLSTGVADEIRNIHLGLYKPFYSRRHLHDCKGCMCMPNWLNNLESVTSYQDIEGVAQSDYSWFHLPQLYPVVSIKPFDPLRDFGSKFFFFFFGGGSGAGWKGLLRSEHIPVTIQESC